MPQIVVIQLLRCGAERGIVPQIMKEIVKVIQQGSQTPRLCVCSWRFGGFDGVSGHFSRSVRVDVNAHFLALEHSHLSVLEGSVHENSVAFRIVRVWTDTCVNVVAKTRTRTTGVRLTRALSFVVSFLSRTLAGGPWLTASLEPR